MLIWLLIIGGITGLLIAANRTKPDSVCKKIVVHSGNTEEQSYIDEADIRKQLEKAANGSLIKKPVASISLVTLERSLEKNPWIKDAELYFDRENVLHVSVEERKPVARIFTTQGSSFYMDSAGQQMPVSGRQGIRVPVFTGYTAAQKLNSKDSAVWKDMKQLALFIREDSFWNAQIGQIDIMPDGRFELTPVIGDHIIRIGNGENVKDKMDRLFLFYKQVLSKTGFNRYAAIDVQYEGQVLGVNKGETSAIDLAQLKKSIQDLLNRSTIQNVSDDMLPDDKQIDSIPAVATPVRRDSVTIRTNQNTAKEKNPVPPKKPDAKTKKPEQPKPGAKQRPKAVLPPTSQRSRQ